MRTVVQSVLLWLVLCGCCFASYPLGTILVSRNTDECENTSPGYWNHVALVVGPNEVVESQVGYGVIRTRLVDYLRRDYSTIWALQPCNPHQGMVAAQRALTLVGLPFRRGSSIVRCECECKGLNCVSVVRLAWRDAWPVVVRAHIPDAIVRRAGATDGVFYGACAVR